MELRRVVLAGLALLSLVGCAGQSEETLSLTSAQPRGVACVGDSNTAGHGARSYVSYLSAELGADYTVTNYGVSGTTAMFSAAFPYSSTAAYAASLREAPDIVVLMLGTNDSDGPSWRGKATFAAEYEELVGTYLALPSAPRVLLCTPPATHLELRPGQVSSYVQPAVYGDINAAIREVAQAHDLTVVDIYSLTQEQSEWFLDDGIHLANTGAEQVAEAIAAAISRE